MKKKPIRKELPIDPTLMEVEHDHDHDFFPMKPSWIMLEAKASTSYRIRKLATTTSPKKISTIPLSTPWELPKNHCSSCFNLGSEKGHFEAVMVYWVRLHNATPWHLKRTNKKKHPNLKLNSKAPTFLTNSTNQSKLQTKTELHTHTEPHGCPRNGHVKKNLYRGLHQADFFCGKIWEF